MTREPINDDALFELVRGAVGAPSETLPDPASGALADRRAMLIFERVLAAEAVPVARTPMRRRAIAPTRIAGLALAAAVIVLVLALSLNLFGTPSSALAKKFPVFASAETELSSSTLEALHDTSVQTSSARAIPTPYGRGYVTTSADGSELCVAIPYGNVEQMNFAMGEHTEGSGFRLIGSCTPVAEAEAKGLLLNAPSRAMTEIVVVLPTGASTPVLRGANGQTRSLAVHDGTTTAITREAATLEYEVNGNRVTASVEPGSASEFAAITPER